MNKKIVVGIHLIFLLSVTSSAFSFQNDTARNIESKSLNFSGNVSLNKSGKMDAIRTEAFFLTPVLKKSFVGVKVGYTFSKSDYKFSDQNYMIPYYYYWDTEMNYTNDPLKTHDLYLGLTYRRNFYEQLKTPFWGCEFQVDLAKIQFTNQSLPKEVTTWDLGSSFLVNLGYSWQMTGKPWGIEVCYSAGISYLNNTYYRGYGSKYIYHRRKYEKDVVGYLRVGYTYYFN